MGKHQEQGRGNARLLLQLQLLAIAISVLGFRSSCAYTIYKVGDDNGWTSTANGVDYTKWASQKPFTVGDMLVFAYESGSHSVLQTSSQEAFEKCNVAVADGKILSSQGSNEANVLLTKPGKTYFFCTASDGSHCRSGMKFAIDVLGGSIAPSGSPATTVPASISPSASDQPVDSTGTPSSSGSIITTPSSSSSNERSSPKSGASRLSISSSLTLLAAMAAAVLLFLS